MIVYSRKCHHGSSTCCDVSL